MQKRGGNEMCNLIEEISILDTYNFCDNVIFYIVEAMNSILPHDRFARSLIDSELALCEELLPGCILHVNDLEDAGYIISKFIASLKCIYAPGEVNQERVKHEIIYHSKMEQPVPIEDAVRQYLNSPNYQGFFGNENDDVFAGDRYVKGLTYIKNTYGNEIYLKVFLKFLFGIAIIPLLFNIVSLSYEYRLHENPKKFQLFDHWSYTNRHENTLMVTTLWNNIMNFHHASHLKLKDRTIIVFNYNANIYVAIDNNVPTFHVNGLSIDIARGSEKVT